MADTTTAAAHEPTASAAPANLTKEYAFVGVILVTTIATLVKLTAAAPTASGDPRLLLAPFFAMTLLTALVWLSMAGVRNYAVMRGISSVSYYDAFGANQPPDWIERPARTFNNLMQVPALFYVALLLMLVMHHVDPAEGALAWLYVGLRLAHAVIYIVWNRISLRFATYAGSCITLAVMWARLATALL